MSRTEPFCREEFLSSRPLFDYDKYPILKEKGEHLVTLFSLSARAFMIKNCKGKLLAVVGVMKMWEGVYEIYIVPTLEAHGSDKGAFIRAIFRLKEKLYAFKEELDIRRLQTVAPDDEMHNRWMENLGFFSEGVLRNYSINCEDHRMWSLLWE